MKKIIYLLLFFTLLKGYTQQPPMEIASDDVFGIKVIDNYRNFENLNDSLVLNWIKEKTKLDKEMLNKIPNHLTLYNRIDSIFKSRENIYRHINYDCNDNVFYKLINSKSKKENMFYKDLKSNTVHQLNLEKIISNENTSVHYVKLNHKGTILALAVTSQGKEITKIYFYDIIKNQLMPQVIDFNWVSEIGGIHWLDDDSGIYYTRLQSNDIKDKDFLKNSQSVLYKLNQPVEKYEVVFSKKSVDHSINEEDFFYVKYISEGWITAEISGVTKSRNVYFSKRTKNQSTQFKWQKLFDHKDVISKYQVVKNDIYYLSNLDNSNVISKTNFKEKNFQNQHIIVKSPKDETIDNLICIKNKKYFTTLKNGIQAFLYEFNEKGYTKIDLPFDAGTIAEIHPKHKDSEDLIIELSGWTQPYTRFILNTKSKTFKEEKLVEKYHINGLENLRVEELEIKTHDGLDMPVSIIYHKDMVKNSKNRTIISAYGAYGSIDEASFNFVDLLWVLDGGICVTAHVRGGGAKGEAWHKGGFKATKSNSWKDLISVTEYLIKEKYTSPKFIGLTGTSAGGTTISNAIIEKPELFKIAQINNAWLNIHRFENSANGANNSKEFGSLKNENEYLHLLNMDAYIKLESDKKYPTMLITAGLNDARVPAWHSAKFVAKLKEYNQEVYFDCDFGGGHAGSSISKALQSLAKSMSFFYWQLGHPDYQLKAD